MTPEKITALLTALAALVVVLTRLRLAKDRGAGRTSVPSALVNTHTGAGSVAVVLWVVLLLSESAVAGWVGLAFWWATVAAGLLILVRWLPASGRRSAGPVADSWGEGPGLSILGHVGMLVGVVIFTLYLSLGKLT